MRTTIIAATLITLAGGAYAQESGNIPLPADWTPGKETLDKMGDSDHGRHLSCTSFNIFFGHLDDPALRNRIGDGIASMGEWCAAQPPAIRRKYGSRY